MMLAVALALSLLIGVSLGLLGGGGSILTVPILVYVLGIDTKSAVATSLLVVGVTSLTALIPHARVGNVRLRTGLTFGGAGVLGAAVGGRLAAYVPDAVLLLMFTVLMLVTALAMMRPRRGPTVSTEHERELPVLRVLATGMAVGGITGLVGAGGGFVVVPALVVLFGLPMTAAVGTSLVAIAMSSLAGLAAYLGHVSIDFSLAAMVASAAVLGSLFGGRLSRAVSPARLRKVFAWFVLAMGSTMLSRQLAPLLAPQVDLIALASRALPWVVLAVATPLAYRLGVARGRRSRAHPGTAPHPSQL